MIEYLSSDNSWEPIDRLLLTEGQSYKIRIGKQYKLHAYGVSLYLDNKNPNTYNLVTPFQTGTCKLSIISNGKEIYDIEIYIYPDNRKIIYDDYIKMLIDILKTKNLGISLDDQNVEQDMFNIKKDFDTFTQVEAKFTLLQSCFEMLIQFIQDACESPIKSKEKSYKKYAGYRTDKIDASAVHWISNNSLACYTQSPNFPSSFKTKITKNTYNTYENLVIQKILKEMLNICNYVYKKNNYLKAKKMEMKILNFFNKSPLKWLSTEQLILQKTSKIKMKRSYSVLFDFYQLIQNISYLVNRNNFSFLSIPISKTYKLYEIWCYIKIVEILADNDKLIEKVSLPTSYNKKEGCIDLAQGNNSVVKLNNGYKMYYQKRFTKGGNPLHTYTSDLIPDICLIKDNSLIVLDAKFRIGENLDLALAELHKYRDGIINKTINDRAVKGSYLLTPTYSKRLEVHHDAFQSKWNMGCIHFNPSNFTDVAKFILKIF